MTRVWLRQLARRLLPGQQLPTKSRRPACLRLEALEDRAVPSSVQFAVPVPTSSPMPPAADGPAISARVATSAAFAPNNSGSLFNATAADDPRVAAGLDALLADLRQSGSSADRGGRLAGSGASFEPSTIKIDTVTGPDTVARRFVFTLSVAGSSNEATSSRAFAAAGVSPNGVRAVGPAVVDAFVVVQAETTHGLARAVETVQFPSAPVGGADTQVLNALAGRDSVAPPVPQSDAVTLLARGVEETNAPATQSADVGNGAALATGAGPRAGPEANPPQLARLNPEIRGPATGNNGDALTEKLPDGLLLQRFVAQRDQTAFTALVLRHQQFVLRICQRVLGDSHAAEDAAQATFLVLARKASLLDGRNSLSGWLYKVAYHVALRLRAVAARKQKWEKGSSIGRRPEFASPSFAEIEEQELRRALYAELQCLPDKYRIPLVLCYLDGRTHAEAALEIGLPRGSIAKRIGEALAVLRERLIGRGLIT